MYGKIKDHVTCRICEQYKGMCVPITYEDEKYYRLTFPDGTSMYLLKENVEIVPSPPKARGLRERVSVTDKLDIQEESASRPKRVKHTEKVEEVQNDSSSES